MSTIDPGPWSDPDSDTVEIDGVEWPGFATVSPTRANKWDDKKSKGEHTGERDFTGADAAKFTIAIRVWKKSQRDQIDNELLPKIEPVPGKDTAKPHKIRHSVCSSRKIDAFTVDDIQGWERTSFDEAVLTIRCQEYRQANTNNAKGKASGTSASQSKCAQLLLEYNAEKASALLANQTYDFVGYVKHSAKADQLYDQMAKNGCIKKPPQAASGIAEVGET